MKTITTINKVKKPLLSKKIRAVSAILGIMLGVGVTITAAGALYVMTSGISDSAITINSIEITNARAYNSGDDAYVSLSVKNTGSEIAEKLNVAVLLECNGAVGAKAKIGNVTKDTITDCDADKFRSSPVAVGPGASKSVSIGSMSNLVSGATASVSGGVAVFNSTGTNNVNVGDNIKFKIGDRYIIEVTGKTPSGTDIVQTASVRVR